MPDQNYTQTDRLSNVIEVIRLGRKSGTLWVRREVGGRILEGEVTFNRGRPVYAKADNQRDAQAMQWLMSWVSCEFIFEQQDVQTMPSIPAITNQTATTGQLSSDVYTLTMGANQYSPAIEQQPMRISSAEHMSPLFAIPERIQTLENGLHFIERYQLSRTYRRLYMLIDGRRTVQDLIVLVGKPPQEVFAALNHLSRARLIQI